MISTSFYGPILAVGPSNLLSWKTDKELHVPNVSVSDKLLLSHMISELVVHVPLNSVCLKSIVIKKFV